MNNPKSKSGVCRQCGSNVKGAAEFCSSCGHSLVIGLRCSNHKENAAVGVCVICCLSYCDRCASLVNKRYLCERHETYEIYEGMARVYGVSDRAAASYVSDCLGKKGLHPFLYSRKASPL
jgi:hypothetical protein